MDIFEAAKEIETKGEALYTELGHEIPVRELRDIFLYMARQEKRHYDYFEAWQKRLEPVQIEKDSVLEDTSKSFAALTEHFKTHHFLPPINYEQAYTSALEFEQKSIDLYQKALDETSDSSKRTAIDIILAQERAHARFLTSLMEFHRHPGEWLENAEFYHTEEY